MYSVELLASLALLYFLPTLVAAGRGGSFWTVAEVAFFNLMAAWTMIGWFIVLGLAIRLAQERGA